MSLLNKGFPVETHNRTLNIGETIDLEWKNELQLIYLKEGSVHYTINGYPNTVETGQLMNINPRQVYYGNVTSDCPVEQVIISFNYNLLMTNVIDIVTEEVIVPLTESKLIFHNIVESIEILTLFDNLHTALANKEPRYELRVKSLLYSFIEVMLKENLYYENKAYKRAREIDSNDITRLILDYIHIHYQYPISLDDLSKNVKISKYHMSRIFKDKTSQTINSYLLNYRLSMSKKLLEETSKNINTICFEVGFNNPSYFIQRFKLAYGVTPNKFR